MEQEHIRVGDAEREAAMQALGVHYSHGRLDGTELEERTNGAIEARFASDIAALFADLPAPHPALPATSQPAAYPPPAPPHPGPPPPLPVPYPQAPMQPYPVSEKSKVVAGVLQICLPFGVGRFYTGHIGLAIAQLLVVLVTFGIGAVWPFIDGIVLAVQGGTDSKGLQLRE